MQKLPPPAHVSLGTGARFPWYHPSWRLPAWEVRPLEPLNAGNAALGGPLPRRVRQRAGRKRIGQPWPKRANRSGSCGGSKASSPLPATGFHLPRLSAGRRHGYCSFSQPGNICLNYSHFMQMMSRDHDRFTRARSMLMRDYWLRNWFSSRCMNSSAALYPCCFRYQLLAAASIMPAASRPGCS